MPDKWVRIRSWHLASGLVSRGGMVHALCGKWAAKDAATAETFPANERTCESCWRNKDIRDRR